MARWIDRIDGPTRLVSMLVSRARREARPSAAGATRAGLSRERGRSVALPPARCCDRLGDPMGPGLTWATHSRASPAHVTDSPMLDHGSSRGPSRQRAACSWAHPLGSGPTRRGHEGSGVRTGRATIGPGRRPAGDRLARSVTTIDRRPSPRLRHGRHIPHGSPYGDRIRGSGHRPAALGYHARCGRGQTIRGLSRFVVRASRRLHRRRWRWHGRRGWSHVSHHRRWHRRAEGPLVRIGAEARPRRRGPCNQQLPRPRGHAMNPGGRLGAPRPSPSLSCSARLPDDVDSRSARCRGHAPGRRSCELGGSHAP